MAIRSTNVVAGIYVVTLLAIFAVLWLLTTGCASTPKGRARQAAVIQKTAVDGVGRSYLEYCEIVRKPSCIAKDLDAQEAGTPQTQAERVACLRPCDSKTAEKLKHAVDVVRGAQTALYLLLKGEPTEAELDEARKQLVRSVDALLTILRDEGVMDLLGNVVGE